MKNMKWKKLFICKTNKASRGGGRKSPKEPAHIGFSSYSGSVSGLGQHKYGMCESIKKKPLISK